MLVFLAIREKVSLIMIKGLMNGAEKKGKSMELKKDGRFKFISSSPVKYITKAGRTDVFLCL